MDEFLEAAKKYAKRYLKHTEDYKRFKDNDYYYISVFTSHIARKQWKDPKHRKRIKEIFRKHEASCRKSHRF